MKNTLRPILFSALLFITTPALAVDDFVNPEFSTKGEHREAVHAKKYMVSAANPLAVEAGVKILEVGGNAVDAAIATQMVLNVVEPQSSGIGGGGFMLYYDAKSKEIHVFDGRETAPKAADEKLFLDAAGKPLEFMTAVQGGLSVGTPGLLKMLDYAHKNYGKQPWANLFGEAIRISKNGFPFSPRLHDHLKTITHIHAFPESMKPYRTESGELKKVGDYIVNTELSNTFSIIAEQGIKPFYEGELAEDIADAVAHSPIHPGKLAYADLKAYQMKERKVVCAPFRHYKVCSMPPPSSGGITVLQILGILEDLTEDISLLKPTSAQAIHYVTEASRLAYADRNRYLADPDFEDVPAKGLLDDGYIRSRAQLISPGKAMPEATPGVPGQNGKKAASIPVDTERPSTTHISVIDAQGNAVSMTTSIEYGFGSGLSVRGFLLNNQLTDFSFEPKLPDGTPHPNRVEAGKRPRSSMSPTLVFDEKSNLLMAIGSPGGGRIIEYVTQTLLGVLAWNLDVQQAINLPHYLNMNGPTELEAGTELEALKPEIEKRGGEVVVQEIPSGLHGIMRVNGALLGGADPRREGVALGK